MFLIEFLSLFIKTLRLFSTPGTYSRGEGGEGDYGDGDIVEIHDNNPYYESGD